MPRPSTPPHVPRAVLNWLAAKYLEDPGPLGGRVASPGRCVLVAFAEFSAFVTGRDLNVVAVHQSLKSRQLIDDCATAIRGECDAPAAEGWHDVPAYLSRLGLGVGNHRLLAIRPGICELASRSVRSPSVTVGSVTTSVPTGSLRVDSLKKLMFGISPTPSGTPAKRSHKGKPGRPAVPASKEAKNVFEVLRAACENAEPKVKFGSRGWPKTVAARGAVAALAKEKGISEEDVLAMCDRHRKWRNNRGEASD